ncbi:hypothetical protein [Carboxylicivirga taeanensis]|uniref:hypothetical protein n=1 Tax=Carboxylicivirga taeanensis TaxID=1416875 RepID=UPI003F6DC202
MKNLLLYSVLVVFIGVFVACEDDDDTNLQPSNTIGVDVDEVTVFDTPFTINFTTSNSNVNELIFNGGLVENLAIAISEQQGSNTFDMDDFGDAWSVGEDLSFSTTIDFGSNESVSYFSIPVIDAVSAEATAAGVQEFDTATIEVNLMAHTIFNELPQGDVEMARKVITEADPNPDFEMLTISKDGKEYHFTEEIFGVDYHLNDTIVYQVTVSSGGLSESTMLKMPVVTKMLGDKMGGFVSDEDAYFAFMPGEEVADAGVLNFVSPRSLTSEDVAFVKIEEGDQVELFADLNKFSKLVQIVDNATLSSDINDIAIGDVYGFVYNYEDVVHYGYLMVNEVHATDIGDATNGIEFSYTQGVKF